MVVVAPRVFSEPVDNPLGHTAAFVGSFLAAIASAMYHLSGVLEVVVNLIYLVVKFADRAIDDLYGLLLLGKL